jgi:hypothetical protein
MLPAISIAVSPSRDPDDGFIRSIDSFSAWSLVRIVRSSGATPTRACSASVTLTYWRVAAVRCSSVACGLLIVCPIATCAARTAGSRVSA